MTGEDGTKSEGAEPAESVLEQVDWEAPILGRTASLARAVSAVGFGWTDPWQVFEKVQEEVGELETELRAEDRERIASELGDVLFATCCLAEELGLDPEACLAATLEKFRRRFGHVERGMRREYERWECAPAGSLDRFWQQAKREEALGTRGESELVRRERAACERDDEGSS
jgi:ATP diphosphatase